MNFRSKVIAIGIIIILSSSAAIYYYLADNPALDPDDDTSIPVIEFQSSLAMDETVQFEGKSYPAMVEITVNDTVDVNVIKITGQDLVYNRIGSQNITLNTTLDPGTHRINFSISPAFSDGQGMVISEYNQDYPLLNYSIYYNATQELVHNVTSLDYNLQAIEAPIYDQANKLTWNVTDTPATVSASSGSLNITSAAATNVSLTTQIDTTGYTRLEFINSSNLSTFQFAINHTVLPVRDGSYVAIGNYFGTHNLTLNVTIEAGGSLDMSLQLLTKSVTLFAAIADNYWAAPSGENWKFRSPSFYIRQVSHQFQKVFNITLIPAKSIFLSSPSSTNLGTFREQILNETGDKLELDQKAWTLGSGSFNENDGFDILLAFTNKTMSNLGVVYGNGSSAFNIAIHARGSLNTRTTRLPPSTADNLIQHEVSHIFGAPDRYTFESARSVMTKSLPDDVFQDILLGFWLYLTNWLENDIQTMTDHNRLLYW